MKNKRMMSAAMAVLMAGSLAACGGSTTASSTAASTASLPLGVYELFLRTGVDPGGHHRPCYRYPVQNPERMGPLRS